MPSTALPAETAIDWRKTYRIVSSRYPPVSLFERIADPSDWEMLAALEGLTNPRLRNELGDIALVAPEDRLSGPGASPIMATFTHVGFASRFSDGSYGVYYASDRFEGALHEVAFHKAQFLAQTREPKTRLELRTYVGAIHSPLHDLRGGWPDVHDPGSYVASQALAAKLRAAHSSGVVFDGVRLPGSANIGIFKARCLAAKRGKPHVVQGSHLFLEWDGTTVSRYLVGTDTTWRSL